MAEPVPTIAELARMGAKYASGTKYVKGKRKNDPMVATEFHVTPLGNALMCEAMTRNGLALRAADEAKP